MKKKILIVFAKSKNEVTNRKAALGALIYAMATVLNKSGFYNVSLNGSDFDTMLQTDAKLPTGLISSKTSFFKNIIPNKIKQIARDLVLFLKINILYFRLKGNDSPHLIIEYYSYGSDIGYKLSRKKNIPLMVVYDAPILDEYAFFNTSEPVFKRLIQKREKKSLQRALITVVYSNPVKRYIENIAGRPLDVAIYQNVDFSRFDFIENKKPHTTINIGFIGSFLKWHRVDLLLNCFIKLKDMGYNVRLFLLGEGSEYRKITNLVEKSNYQRDILTPGYVDEVELLNYKKQIDIGVMPSSNWYGAPSKIFEYGASGMAVVAPDTGTIKDIFIHDKDLLLFENESEDSLFMALKRLCDDSKLKNELAFNLTQKIKNNYSENIAFDFYTNLIERALK